MSLIHTRIAVLLLSGFFFSCTSAYIPLADRTDLTTENSRDKLAGITEKLHKNANDPSIWHQSGILKSIIAKNSPVNQRESWYSEMRADFLKADSLYPNTSGGKIEKAAIRESLQSDWKFEHNSAAGIFNSDSTSVSRVNLAISHVTNALSIAPDSIISYKLKSDLHLKQSRTSQSLEVALIAVENAVPGSESLFERIAYLNTITGNLDAAAIWYQRALDTFCGDVNLRNGYINLLITSTRYEEALQQLDVVQKAVPEELGYRGVKAIILLRILELESAENHTLTFFGHFPEALGLLVGQDAETITNAALISSNIVANLYSESDSEIFNIAFETAVQLLEEAVELNQDNKELKDRLELIRSLAITTSDQN